MANYSGQINWGDWQSMPAPPQWQDKNKSFIAQIAAYLDPHSSLGYMPVFKDQKIFRDGTDFYNKGQDAVWTTANRVLEPVMKISSAIGKYTDPVQSSLSKTFPEQHQGLTDWVSTHGADAAAIAAATYFTAGAAGAAAGSAAGGGAAASGAAAAPAASGAAGATGGLAGSAGAGAAAITPAFASGAAGAGGAVTAGAGAAAITPTFGAAGLSLAPVAASGGLGAAGTAAANALLTPAFASWGAGAGSGLLGTVKGLASKAKQYDSYRSNIKTVADADQAPTERAQYNQQAGALADRILNAGAQPQTPRQRIAKQMMFNRMGPQHRNSMERTVW